MFRPRPSILSRVPRSSLQSLRKPTLSRTFFWSSSSSSSSSSIPPHLPPTSIPSIPPDLAPLILASLLSASDDETDAESYPSPPWIVKGFEGGLGMGVVASRDIKMGELLVAERPLCVWPQGLTPEGINELYSALSPRQQSVFMSLATNEQKEREGMDPLLARRGTNGFSVTLPVGGRTVGMVFPSIARINHSCLPNASQAFNFTTLRMEVYALTSIPTSTPISIEYLPTLITQTHSERQSSLQTSFGIPRCLCSLCTSSPEVIAASDKRRREIKAIGGFLAAPTEEGRGGRQGKLAALERVRVLLEEEGYKGLPEWDDRGVSNAFSVFVTMKAREERERREQSA